MSEATFGDLPRVLSGKNPSFETPRKGAPQDKAETRAVLRGRRGLTSACTEAVLTPRGEEAEGRLEAYLIKTHSRNGFKKLQATVQADLPKRFQPP